MTPYVEDEAHARADELFRAACLTHGAAVFKDVRAAVERHDLRIGETPLPVNPKPSFATPAERALFAEASEAIARILEKAVRLFPTHASHHDSTTGHTTNAATNEPTDEHASMSGLTDALGEHVRASCVMRFDAAYRRRDGVLKFLEFNCDSPSGLGWHH
ncbi:MAG TPA: hypothetical protein VGV59_12245, partial [Pyrinomonadaceae bacterium]|nr:hypothetical protein [Pyrinomonadaceae bacterium]